jgi:BirA family biotin operon repressor/biotin-[acetyl-CoA-carboxylase] ligase
MSRVGTPLILRDEVDSTNTLAREFAEQGADHGTAVAARRQTAGRGRRGRTWLTLPGDHVYLSVILRPTLPPERLFEVTLVAAVALSEALEKLGVRSQIKWPNDIEIDGKKLAGILTELTTDAAGQMRFVILGVGVNVNTAADEFPDEIRERATSLRVVTGAPGEPQEVIAAFLDRLDDWLERHGTFGLTVILDAWRAKSSTLGSVVRATTEGRVIEGTAEDVDSTGALLIRDGSGQLYRIIAGEVITLRRRP